MSTKTVKKPTQKKLAKSQLPKPDKKQEKPAQANKVNVREIDASGQVLGRLATSIANILRGKDKPSFRAYKICGDKVVVNNASKIVLTGKKLEQKVYQRHTGYLGHLKTVTTKELMIKNPSEVLKKAVFGMLPKNKLRDLWMKNLTINN